ncbi:MAG: (d)CMP kinase [Myxococcales bacterium]|nr:(d)CMP kinase [Myxococcales bacterium]
MSTTSLPHPIITIDGPAGAGKSTISRNLARTLGFTYIDTGAMFRAIALAAQQAQVPWQDETQLAALLPSIQLEFRLIQDQLRMFLNGQDVEDAIRTAQMGLGASAISIHPSVRTFLLAQQRHLGLQSASVLEGRDTGTVVFPDAPLKFYLDASAHERAKRRLQQLGPQAKETLEEIQKQIEDRDRADMERQHAPLRCPQDAIRIDTSLLSPEEVLQQMLDVAQSRFPQRTMPTETHP